MDNSNSFIWIFGLLILMGLFNGGFGFGGNGFANAIGYQNLATQNDVQRGFDTAALQDQSRDILSAVNAGTAQGVAATSQAKYDNINVMKDVQAALSGQISDVRSMEQNILGQTAQCCCDTKQLIQATAAETNANIAQSKYETAMALAGMEQRLEAGRAQDKIEALQAQVSNLQLQNAMAGVLRFPNQWTYGAGPFPPIYGACGVNV